MTIDVMQAMDDAELGRQIKNAARRSALEDVTPIAMSRMAALLLIVNAFPVNATVSTVRLKNVTYKGEEKGDWTVTARRLKTRSIKVCPVCSKEFQPGREDKVCCSDRCRKRKSFLKRKEGVNS